MRFPYGFTVDVTYVGRRGLYLQRERNINQLPLGTIQANPGVNIAALRPYTGYRAIRPDDAGRSEYNSLQLSIDRRYRNGLKVGAAYTLGKSEDNGSNKRVVLWNTYDDTAYWGTSEWDRRHNLNFYYIYDLPFWRDQSNLIRKPAGRMADLRRHLHAQRRAGQRPSRRRRPDQQRHRWRRRRRGSGSRGTWSKGYPGR